MSKIIDTSEPKQAPVWVRYRKAGIIALIVIVVAVGAYFALSGPAPLITNKEKKVVNNEADASKLVDEATAKIAAGNAKQALEDYDSGLESAKGNKQAELVLLLAKSQAALDANDAATALSAAQQAYDIKKTSGTASQLAAAYEKKGDKTKAIQYYKEAITLISPEELKSSNVTKILFERKITQLGGTL